jgi:hypothetical protein
MLTKYYYRLYSKVFMFITVCACAGVLSGQDKTLDRDLEPVVLMGSQFSLYSDFPLSELFLFAYHAATDQWQQIPFQFDEQTGFAGQGDYFAPDDGLMDGNDDVSFMAMDAGDDGVMSWIPNVESRAYVRYCIEVVDPLTDNKGWVYLYRSNTITTDPGLADYVAYSASTTSKLGEDKITSFSYEIANSASGFPLDLQIFESNGSPPLASSATQAFAVDLLAGLEFQAQARVSFFTLSISQDDINFDGDGDGIDFVDGRIRILRRPDATLSVSVINANFAMPPQLYYPYSVAFDLDLPTVDPASILNARVSLNLNSSAMQMNWESAKNSPVVVDGVADTGLDLGIVDLLPDGNWSSVTGDLGTIVHFFSLDQPSNAGSVSGFYSDNSGAGSYGNTGIVLDDGVTTPLNLGYRGYFFQIPQAVARRTSLSATPSNFTGSQIAEFEQNPLQATAVPQDFGSVPVELVSFSASTEGTDIRLAWLTATETNNLGFDLERRPEAGEWQVIAFVAGKGTITTPTTYEYLDRSLQAGTYEYRLKQIDTNGSFEYFNAVTASIGVPETFALHQNFPNPFNPSTQIQYELSSLRGEAGEAIRTVLSIYNMLGQRIRTLVDKEEKPGFYSVTWDGRDEAGETVATGVYVYRILTGSFTSTKKMVFIQ